MDVTGVGNVAKNKRRGEVNIQSEDWDLVCQSLSANCSNTMFNNVCERLVPAPCSWHLYYAGYSIFIPTRYSDDRILPFFPTNTVSVAFPTEIINDFFVN